MRSLGELQAVFGAALCDAQPPESTAGLWSMFSEPQAIAERRLAAYRRNVIGNWRSALASTYPVLAQLLGAQRFCALAERYVASCPSCCGDLNAYGGGMAELLAASELCSELPYLPDLARLEWALLAAYGAASAAELDLAALAAVPAAAQGDLHFTVWAGAALIESRWPLVDIWQAHQLADGERDAALAGIDLMASTSCRALVVRRAGRVSPRALRAGEAAFLRALHCGLSLAEAIAGALAEDAAGNPGAALQRLVALRTITGFKENANECCYPA